MNKMKSETMLNACVRDNEHDFACIVFASTRFFTSNISSLQKCVIVGTRNLREGAKKNHSGGNIRWKRKLCTSNGNSKRELLTLAIAAVTSFTSSLFITMRVRLGVCACAGWLVVIDTIKRNQNFEWK